MAPPVPIPNTEVKRCSPDDSTSIGCAKVGRRQSYEPVSAKAGTGSFFAHHPDIVCASVLSASRRGSGLAKFSENCSEWRIIPSRHCDDDNLTSEIKRRWFNDDGELVSFPSPQRRFAVPRMARIPGQILVFTGLLPLGRLNHTRSILTL